MAIGGNRGFGYRMMRLCRRVAPIRFRGRRKVPENEPPAGPKLVVGRGIGRRKPREMSLADALEIGFWTLIGVAAWFFMRTV